MLVTFTVRGAPATYEMREENDVREMAREIEAHIRTNHSEAARETLLVLVMDALLNGLADGSEEVDLGEITTP